METIVLEAFFNNPLKPISVIFFETSFNAMIVNLYSNSCTEMVDPNPAFLQYITFVNQLKPEVYKHQLISHCFQLFSLRFVIRQAHPQLVDIRRFQG